MFCLIVCNLKKKITGDALFKMRTYCLVLCLRSPCDTISCLPACQPYWILLVGDEILLFQFQTQMWPSHFILLCVHFASTLAVHTPAILHHSARDLLRTIQYGHETCKNLSTENAKLYFS